jgi:glycosyltransferase involved in cell wall biosynthesis
VTRLDFSDSLWGSVKKVLQVDFSGSWDRGGCLSHIVRAWARNSRNYEQCFASWTATGFRGELEGRPHYGFDESRLANRIFNKILRSNKFCFYSLIPVIEELKPDILHFHNRHNLVDQIMGRLSYRPKVVCIYHQLYNQLCVPQTSDLLIGVGKLVVAWIDRKTDPSQRMAVLHNPFRKVPTPPRKESGKTFFLNYANQPKPTRDLFAAVELLQAEGFDFELRSVGHVFPDLPVPRGVTVSNFVPQPEFLEIAAQASAYICTTYATPFSVAVLEAMARKTPVICPWDIGALDLLPSDCVLSYESHSAVEIANAMRQFLKMPEPERAALAERALTLAAVAYDEAALTQRLEGLYDTLFA